MPDLSATYLGLTLRNPIIVGSSGLTDSVAGVRELESNGAGAVVLKSIFEEEILFSFDELLREAAAGSYQREYLNYLDYYDYELRTEHLEEYIDLVKECKGSVSIPVIASVNCTYSHEWAVFASRLESAGADALELNMFFLPTDFTRSSEEIERAYFEVIERVRRVVSIPIALKISYYFTNLGPMIERLSHTGVEGLVLFNRFWSPDIDIDNLDIIYTNVFSTPGEVTTSLRWIALMAGRVGCDLIASTGVHDGRAVIKQILAGASAVQVVSALYKHGSAHIQTMLGALTHWMSATGYESLDQFRGKLSQAGSTNPAAYERVQFMKYFSGRR